MANLVALFLLSLALIAGGAYLSTNPESLQKYRRNSVHTSSNLQSTSDWKIYVSDPPRYRFRYPKSWELETDVPGCGPVWFATMSKKVWLTMCGPYSGYNASTLAIQAESHDSVLSGREELLIDEYHAIKQKLTLEAGSVSQVFIEHSSGVYTLFFTDLETKDTFETQFNEIINTFVFD
jgi:hypothetical protein